MLSLCMLILSMYDPLDTSFITSLVVWWLASCHCCLLVLTWNHRLGTPWKNTLLKRIFGKPWVSWTYLSVCLWKKRILAKMVGKRILFMKTLASKYSPVTINPRNHSYSNVGTELSLTFVLLSMRHRTTIQGYGYPRVRVVMVGTIV